MARVTYSQTQEACKTSITLQDGCFGAGALMRIAAMFVRPDHTCSVQEGSDVQLQAAPVTSTAAGAMADAANAQNVPEPQPSSFAEAVGSPR